VPELTTLLAAWGVALLITGVLDAWWLGSMARRFYRRALAPWMAEPVRWLPAVLFYLGYPLALVLLALTPWPEDGTTAAWRSALAGLMAYGTYDLTNLATVRGWPRRLAPVDMAWGTVASAAAGWGAWMVLT
jgi:uncharacterized membrane protein